MSENPQYFRIGSFVLGGIAILAVGLIIFGASDLFKPKLLFETYVNGTVQGLDVGSPLKFRGVTVGKVTQVGFVFNEYPQQFEESRTAAALDSQDPSPSPEASEEQANETSGASNYVVVVMEVNVQIFPGMFRDDLTPLLKKNIQQGLRMRIEPQGITGLNFMNIDYLKKAQMEEKQFRIPTINWTPRYYYIPSAPGELTSMLDAANEMMREMHGLMEEFNDKDFHQMITDGKSLMENMNKMIVDLDAQKLSKQAQSLLASIQASNEHLQVIFKNLEPATKINADQMNAIISNTRAITDNLRTLSENLKQNPSSLIFSRPPPKSKVFAPAKPGHETR